MSAKLIKTSAKLYQLTPPELAEKRKQNCSEKHVTTGKLLASEL